MQHVHRFKSQPDSGAFLHESVKSASINTPRDQAKCKQGFLSLENPTIDLKAKGQGDTRSAENM